MRVITDKNEWDFLLDKEFKEQTDVFFRYGYFELYKKFYGALPEAIFWEDKNVKIFWTRLVRDISKIELFKDLKYFDLTTPYGYGGPLIIEKTEDREMIEKSLKKFFKDYNNHALKNNYVCEFIRFQPTFKHWKCFDETFRIEHLNSVVIVDVEKDLADIWQNIKKGHRYNVKKTLRENCQVNIMRTPLEENIDNFVKTYNLAMDKNRASQKYYFSKEFINDHFKFLSAILIEVSYKDEVIGSSIFILSDKIIHYHLSGANDNFKGVYPSNLMLWEAIKWAKGNGFKYLHLGGGRGKNDSLFEFKKGFSNLTKPFKMGKIIFNQKIYDKLSDLNKEASHGFFPKYRQSFDETIV